MNVEENYFESKTTNTIMSRVFYGDYGCDHRERCPTQHENRFGH